MEFNNAFFDELGRSAGVRSLCDDAAERVAARARSAAPKDTGAYRNGIGTAGKFQRRYVALVVASDEKSMLIESQRGILARALRGAGRRG